MSRKAVVPLLVLVLSLLWSLPSAAADRDPNTCLPSCYAYNQAPTDGDGTKQFPWKWNKDDPNDLSALRDAMARAVENRLNSATLEVIDCTDDLTSCTAIVYTYTRSGDETAQPIGEVPVPDVGVSVPFPYFLGGGALLGALLVFVGIVFVRRGRR
jgi:hypothetical protein